MFHKFNHIRKYLSTNDLNEIQAKIYSIESKSSGEVKLCLKHKIEFWNKSKSIEDLAKKYFLKFGMHKTKDRNGVLILILFKERKVTLLGDTGIHSKIKDDFWNNIISGITKYFSDGKYKEGILYFLNEVGQVLEEFFPYKEGDTNELSDEIIIK